MSMDKLIKIFDAACTEAREEIESSAQGIMFKEDRAIILEAGLKAVVKEVGKGITVQVISKYGFDV